MLFLQYHKRMHELMGVGTHSVVYDEIFSHKNLFDFLRDHDLEDRCHAYFHYLSMLDPEWLVDPKESVKYDYAAFGSLKDFSNSIIGKWKKEKKAAEDKNQTPPPEPTDEEMRNAFNKAKDAVHNSEQRLHNFVAHFRVFDKCYLNPSTLRLDLTFVRKQQQFLKLEIDYQYTPDEATSHVKAYKDEVRCQEIESRLFPWLSFEYPIYKRHDGVIESFPGSPLATNRPKGCFVQDFKKRANGKGIVMTVGDGHVSDAVKLIRLLRYLDNKLPIQIVYYLGLSDESEKKLIEAARVEYRGKPKQVLWFVDARRSIKPEFLDKFSGFANKVLATMFNSFEEIFFVDADSVIFKKPTYFFKLAKYTNSGTLFFKDRSAAQFRAGHDLRFFSKLCPSVDDLMMFNIPQLTGHTLHNSFFNGYLHFMESGVVLLNRKRHFMQPFMMSLLNFYSPVMKRIYGDKELFWLAIALMGEESYEFNDNFAAAVGEITPEVERNKDIDQFRHLRSHEICSNHPTHISDHDNRTILWMNSGFRFCGKTDVNYEKEFEQRKRFTKFKTVESFKTFFESRLEIKQAIIPPYDPVHIAAKNDEHEPEFSWVMAPYCSLYTWCAYSSVGGLSKDSEGQPQSNLLEGKFIEYTPKEQAKYAELGDVWMGAE